MAGFSMINIGLWGGGDPDYIQGQLHLSWTVLGHWPSVLNQKEAVVDSDNDDPNSERDVPPVGGEGWREGGDGGCAIPCHKQLTQDPPVPE